MKHEGNPSSQRMYLNNETGRGHRSPRWRTRLGGGGAAVLQVTCPKEKEVKHNLLQGREIVKTGAPLHDNSVFVGLTMSNT